MRKISRVLGLLLVAALFTLTGCSGTTSQVVAPLLLGFFLFQRQFINSFMRSGIK